MRFHILLVIIFVYSIEGYVNKYDAEFEFECEDGKHIGRIYSWFNKKKKDRKWGFDCKKGGCFLFYGPIFLFINSYLWVRMVTVFEKCCFWVVWQKMSQAGLVSGKNDENNCNWTEPLNNYDYPVNFTCPEDQIITGFHSYHSNWKEDRRWYVKCCKVSMSSNNIVTPILELVNNFFWRVSIVNGAYNSNYSTGWSLFYVLRISSENSFSSDVWSGANCFK